MHEAKSKEHFSFILAWIFLELILWKFIKIFCQFSFISQLGKRTLRKGNSKPMETHPCLDCPGGSMPRLCMKCREYFEAQYDYDGLQYRTLEVARVQTWDISPSRSARPSQGQHRPSLNGGILWNLATSVKSIMTTIELEKGSSEGS